LIQLRFILSTWQGFEIDSSEFSATITVKDAPRTIKAFIGSPFIEDKFSCSNIGSCFFRALELAKSIDEQRFKQIKFGTKSLEDYLNNYIEQIVELFNSSKTVKEDDPSTLPEGRHSYEFISSTEHSEELDKEVEYTYDIILEKWGSDEYYFNPLKQALLSYSSINKIKESKELLEISVAIKFLIDEFPHLAFEFDDATVSFDMKTEDEEYAWEYLFALSGKPIIFSVPLGGDDQWESVLNHIAQKTDLEWDSWM